MPSGLVIANLILWFIGFAIVAMASKERKNAIENAESYLGKFGAKTASLISILIFPIWFVSQIHTTTIPLDAIFYGLNNTNQTLTTIYGCILGIFIAFLAMKKTINKIKKLNTYLFPFLILYYIYAITTSKIHLSNLNEIHFSWPCTLAYISFLFAGMVNLPTFFKHSRSKYDSYLSLSTITIIITFFHISSFWIDPTILKGYIYKTENKSLFLLLINNFFVLIFSLVLLTCSNLVNLYFASPSWELLIPKIKKYPKFLIIGLFSSALYLFSREILDLYPFLLRFEEIADDFIANLGIALILIFLFRIIIRHRPRPNEQFISTIAWFIGCLGTSFAAVKHFETPPLWIGIQLTILVFALTIFLEEPFWCFKKIKKL